MNYFYKFWAVIGFSLTLFGIFWLPKDLSDWEQAADSWQRIFAMIDQNTALWAFSLCALAYIFWIDLRPYVKDRANSKRKLSKVEDRLVSSGAYLTWDSLSHSTLKRMAFQIPLENLSDQRINIEVKKVSYFYEGNLTNPTIEGGDFDIQPKQKSLFTCPFLDLNGADIEGCIFEVFFELQYGTVKTKPYSLVQKTEIQLHQDSIGALKFRHRNLSL